MADTETTANTNAPSRHKEFPSRSAARDTENQRRRCEHRRKFKDIMGNERFIQCDMQSVTKVGRKYYSCLKHSNCPPEDFAEGTSSKQDKLAPAPEFLDAGKVNGSSKTQAKHEKERRQMESLPAEEYLTDVIKRQFFRDVNLVNLNPTLRYLVRFKVPVGYIALTCKVSKSSAVDWTTGRNGKLPEKHIPRLNSLLELVYTVAHKHCAEMERSLKTTKQEQAVVVQMSSLLLEVKEHLERLERAGGRI